MALPIEVPDYLIMDHSLESMQLSLLSLLGLRSCDDDDRRDESEFRSHCVAEATEECGGDDLNRRRPNSKPV